MIKEKPATSWNGYSLFALLLLAQIVGVALIIAGPMPVRIIAGLFSALVVVCWFGFFIVAPNQGRVLQLFGKYVGTERRTGLRWANPLYSKKKISLRVRNFESGRLKVNDARGNPIEIACVVVWKVVDTAEAYFEVDDYESFVTIQSESALRNLANLYPYEPQDDENLSLRGDPIQVADKIKDEVQDRLEKAGVQVIESRITHLAYSPEIAQAMLRKQQAGAILAARRLIVQGAVEMVTDALERLTDGDHFSMDEERKAAMISNLMVVICGDQPVQPVVNAGSLY